VREGTDPGETRGDVRASTDGNTYVHGDSSGPGPQSTQEARSGVGRDRGAKEIPMVPKDRPRTYYDRPVVKEPVWKPEVPWYFFTGGLGGTSAALAYAAGRIGNHRLAWHAWAFSFVGIATSPMLLISDLGRPERFFNMLRVFKVTSPMSVGSWLLVANAATITPAASASVLGFPKRLGRRAEPVAALLGLPLTTYTAVLIANSAIPAWSEARRELPLLFASGGAASAGAAAVITTPTRYAAPARRLAILGAIGELAVGELMKRRLGPLGRSYEEGEAGKLDKISSALTLAGGALMARAARRRPGAVVAGTLLLAGAACKRWAVFKAGFASAEDPHQTVAPQRQRVEERKREAEIEGTAISG
jgi:formate-dependent nitrite reductase membrane component NrfD